jgi:hypothetical protein
MKTSVRRRRLAAGTPQEKDPAVTPARASDRAHQCGHLRTPFQKGATPEPAIDTPAAQLQWHRREAALINRLLSDGAWDRGPLVAGLQIHLDQIARFERQGVARV